MLMCQSHIEAHRLEQLFCEKKGAIVLPPGCRFRVESVLPQGDRTIIQLTELPSKEWIVNLNPNPNAMGVPPAAAAPHLQGVAAAEVSDTSYFSTPLSPSPAIIRG